MSVLIFGIGVQNGYTSLMTYDFTGDVTFVSPGLSGYFNTTHTVSGSITYDTSTPDSYPDIHYGNYQNAITDLQLP